MKVNNTQTTRDRIIEHLYKAAGHPVSGVTLAGETGISRVAVWKHIKALKAMDIDIDSRPTGYALAAPHDLLYPFCFDRLLQDKIMYFPEVKTTMDTARNLAREGIAHLSCCVAERQTRGRGRLNRTWISDKGGLWFTLILRPDLPPPMVYIYNFAASLSLSRTINRITGLSTRVKWPNDILLDGQKLCGLLSEMETRADMVSFLNIGIGINVNNDPSGEKFEATSLINHLGSPVSRRQILSEFLLDFMDLTQKTDIPHIMAQWRRQTATIGTRVRVETHTHINKGLAVGVDDNGSLIIETDTGETQTIVYGDCFHDPHPKRTLP